MQSDGDAEVDRRAWASVPWSAVSEPGTGLDTGADTPIGWHKSGISYPTPGAAAAPLPLQTLDVWIPASTTTTPPDPSSLPPTPPGSTWIVYIHGGAWRDPRISAASFTAAATALLLQDTSSSSPKHKLAGLISLNYRLSPHPSHPSSPSDPSRQAKHPDHITDVRAALAFLHRLPILSNKECNWVLAGHSCGATLAFQAVMDPARWGLPPSSLSFGPSALVGFNGLYDLAGFIASPPAGYEHLREGYREFVEGAFGGDEKVWRAVCPVTAEGSWVGEWIGGGVGKGVVLVQSREDTLVPWEQVEAMRGRLEGREGVEVRVLEAAGEHDEIWREGERMAEVLWEVVGGL